MWTTLQPIFSASRLQKYLLNDAVELTARVLCLVSLFLAANYTREDYETVKVGMLHKESILSFTVLLLWIRLVRVMQISSTTGALVYMLNMMIRDVVRWLIIYLFGLVAFSAGMYVLYRNRRAAIGSPHWRLGAHDECGNLGPMLGDSVIQAAIYLGLATLEGSDSWECFYQSSAQMPGMVMLCCFLIVVVIMLLNTLIAMMAETFTNVSTFAFRNYASSFGNMLVAHGSDLNTAVPSNLLSIPYILIMHTMVVASNAWASLCSKEDRLPRISGRRDSADVLNATMATMELSATAVRKTFGQLQRAGTRFLHESAREGTSRSPRKSHSKLGSFQVKKMTHHDRRDMQAAACMHSLIFRCRAPSPAHCAAVSFFHCVDVCPYIATSTHELAPIHRSCTAFTTFE